MNEYYSVIRKREFLPYATIWMNLEDIMLSKIRQIQKDKYCMISLIHGILKKKKKKQSRMVVSRNWSGGNDKQWSNSTSL